MSYISLSSRPVVTNEFISKATLKTGFCHCGLAAILLLVESSLRQERFPTSGNDIECGLTYEFLSTIFPSLP